MGKKSGYHKHKPIVVEQNSRAKKLSPQKRHDINEVVAKLLKISSQVQNTSANKQWELYVEINKLLQKLNTLENSMKIAPESRSDLFSQLVEWIKNNNGEIDNISITEYPLMDYGLQADKDFKEGDLICSIPRKIMMTYEDAENSVLKHLIQTDPMLQHMNNIALALFLIIEYSKGADSFWYPYITSLPESYNTVLYFTISDFQCLKCSPTLEPALKQYKHIARQYAYLNKLFQNAQDPASQTLRDIFTFELYGWAVSTVMTRQNYVPSTDGQRTINALIPFWDMCNHTNGYLTTEFKIETNSSHCYACQDFNKGNQILIFYGSRCNADFLVHNGFVFPNNEHDTFKLKLGISKADPLQGERTQLLNKLGVPACDDFYLNSGCQPVDGRLLAFLRVFNMDKVHLEHWLESDRSSDLMYIDCALDTQVESKTWNFILNRIQLLLSAYTKINNQDNDTSSCRRIVQLQLTLEQKLLETALEYVRQRIKA